MYLVCFCQNCFVHLSDGKWLSPYASKPFWSIFIIAVTEIICQRHNLSLPHWLPSKMNILVFFITFPYCPFVRLILHLIALILRIFNYILQPSESRCSLEAKNCLRSCKAQRQSCFAFSNKNCSHSNKSTFILLCWVTSLFMFWLVQARVVRVIIFIMTTISREREHLIGVIRFK